MQTKLKIIAIVVAVLTVVAISYLYLTRKSAVVFRYGDRATEQNALLIQNPFRERGPEDEAEKILQELTNGNCEKILKLPTLDAEHTKDSCDRESVYPIQKWSIADRQDFGKQSILVYSVSRADRSDPTANTPKTLIGLAWIDVEKAGEDRWRVLSYQTYY